MKKVHVATALLACLFTSSPCYANLGDTLEKCEARYGHPLPGKDAPDPSGVADVILTFKSNGYAIRVILARGRVAGECFAKVDGSPLSTAEKKLILQNDSQGWSWAVSTGTAGENWIRTDGAVATYVLTAHALVLETGPYVAAVKAKDPSAR
jgi:hypothetical protein